MTQLIYKLYKIEFMNGGYSCIECKQSVGYIYATSEKQAIDKAIEDMKLKAIEVKEKHLLKDYRLIPKQRLIKNTSWAE